MLKAHLINRDGLESIYYPNKPDRTISLENCIRKVFTNKHAPLRLNLERIIDLRNTSTHFITEDYEAIYTLLFQSCLLNYAEKLQEFHNVDITQKVASSFLTLNISVNDLSDNHIKVKYSKETAERLIRERNEIQGDINTENASFAIPVETRVLLTRSKNEADVKVKLDNNSQDKIRIAHDIKDSNSIYIYSTRQIIKLVNRRLKSKKIKLIKIKDEKRVKEIFNSYDFQL